MASEDALTRVDRLLAGGENGSDMAWLRAGLRHSLASGVSIETALGLDSWRKELRCREMRHRVHRAARSLGPNITPWSASKVLHHETAALGWPVSGAVNTPIRAELYCAILALGGPLPTSVQGFYTILTRPAD